MIKAPFDISIHAGDSTAALKAIAKAQPRRCGNNSNSSHLEDFEPWETDGLPWVGIMVVFEPPFFLITMKQVLLVLV